MDYEGGHAGMSLFLFMCLIWINASLETLISERNVRVVDWIKVTG